MVVKNLEFFDKNGYNLNLNWNEQKQIWEGNIFFPKISVGLFENTTIYIVEGVEHKKQKIDTRSIDYPNIVRSFGLRSIGNVDIDDSDIDGSDVDTPEIDGSLEVPESGKPDNNKPEIGDSDDDPETEGSTQIPESPNPPSNPEPDVPEIDEPEPDVPNDDCTYVVYSYPTGEGDIVFQWDLANTFVDEFFMFNFDEDYELKDTSSLIYTPYDGPVCETLIINRFDKYIVPLLNDSNEVIENDELLEVHVAFRADEKSAETTYKRTLIISYEDSNSIGKVEVARITFYAETIEEDERLKIWNENLGYNLKPKDTIMFKQSDIHEYMPNFELLNEKRKELMLEGHNIYPYIGSYKALINAIKFFGYDNLNIVEYWRNINEYDSEYGKIYRTYVYSLKDRKTLSTKRKSISLNTKDFQKLNNISLVYNINHTERNEEGKKYDEYGLPNVIEDFDKTNRDDFILTIEEALVKLFALKKKLNDEFMPGSTKITDVIGEGNYFGVNLIGNNPQISYINYVESKGNIDFTVFPDKHCYITENEDFARYVAEKTGNHVDETVGNLGNMTIGEIEKMYDDINLDNKININEIDTMTLGDIINGKKNDIICDYYEEYYNITYDNNFGDANEFGLREMPEARNVYKNDADDVSNMNICAKVILKGEFSENVDITSIIEWKITYLKDDNKTEEWIYTGDVKTYGNVFVQLPYLGSYDVEMTVWDTYNHCSKQQMKNAIVVEPYNIDIRGFYLDARPLPNELKYDLMIPLEFRENNTESNYKYYLWVKNDDVKDNIDNSGLKKYIVTRKRNPIEMSLSDIFGNLDDVNSLENIIGIDNKNKLISIVNDIGEGDGVLKISWISDISYGVDEYKYEDELKTPPFDENDSYSTEWTKDELYNVIKKNVDKMYSWALQEHLGKDDVNSTMRNYKSDGSVSSKGPYYKFDVNNIKHKINKGYTEYNHLNDEIIDLKYGEHYKYVRYINNIVDIKPLTWVLLGFDFTRITGRVIDGDYPKWTLIMDGDSEPITTHVGLYFTYLFEKEGVYRIKLDLKDINGNIYNIEKPIVIVDKDANYEMYHTLKDEYDIYLEAKNERNLIYLN